MSQLYLDFIDPPLLFYSTDLVEVEKERAGVNYHNDRYQ